MDRRYAYWICQIGGWTAFSGVRAAIAWFSHELMWRHFAMAGLIGAVGLAYTHLFREVIRRYGWTELNLRQLAVRVVPAVLLISVAMHYTVTPVGRYVLELEVYDRVDSQVALLVSSITNGSIIILLWSVIYFGVHHFWHHQQAEIDKWKLEAQAETARLQALKLQLNPHFFFNSLNSVRALISNDPERAEKMVTRLARLLRATLQAGDVKTVPLEEELSTVRTYLELESVRFEDRLQYEIDVDPEVLSRPVPFLIVQTLVENGIKHGVAKRTEGGLISIRAQVEDGDLLVRVTNPGTVETDEGGVGLSNARERLQLLFGDDASLSLRNRDEDTVVATVRLPSQRAPSNPEALDGAMPAELIDG